jgi:hypothetical protein
MAYLKSSQITGLSAKDVDVKGFTQAGTLKLGDRAYTEHEVLLADNYNIVGDVTVSDNLILSKLSDDGNAINITGDTTTRTITGSGSIEGATLAQTPNASLTGMTGVLNSAVTGELNSAIIGSPALHLNNTTGTIPSAVTGGTGLTPTIDYAFWTVPVSLSGTHTTYLHNNGQGTAISRTADRGTITIAGYYYGECYQRCSADMDAIEMYRNGAQSYTYGGTYLGGHDHGRGGAYTYTHANFMGYLAVGDYIHAKCGGGIYSSSTNTGYNGGMYLWRLR